MPEHSPLLLPLPTRRGPWRSPGLIWWLSAGGTALAALAVGGAAAVLVWQSLPLWGGGLWDFLTGRRWFFRDHQFGALAMIHGTAVVSMIALATAGPIGVGAAVFTSEILPLRLRMPVKMAVELLAGIPSVIYGLLGILLLREWMYRALAPFDPVSGDSLLTAGLLLGVMILPTVMTLADDALCTVPGSCRRAARALGLTRAETVFSVSLPGAWRQIVGALLLALGRAMGEGIAVFMVVGRQDNQLPGNPFSPRAWMEAGQTLTSKLVGAEINIAYGDPLHWAAMMGLGLLLLALVGACTWAASLGRSEKEPHATPMD